MAIALLSHLADAVVPAKCPRCAHRQLHVQVVTWAVFNDGACDYVESDEDLRAVAGSVVVCAECQTEWVL